MVSLVTVFGNLGVYVSTYWLSISGVIVPFGTTDFEKAMLVMAVITAIMALFTTFKKEL